MSEPSFAPGATVDGELPPWETAKAFAFHTVLAAAAERLGIPAAELVGSRVDEYIAQQIKVKGGGHPLARQVRRVIARCQDPEWYPGKRTEARKGAGRPPQYSQHQKQEVARVAMGLKRQLIAPTPRRVRARLPEKTRHPSGEGRMSDDTIQSIFKTMCFDETPDDPWQWLASPSQDYLPAELKPLRVKCASHIRKVFTARSWYGHVAVDPCYTLLPRTPEKLEEQKVAAMGKVKWMSKQSARKGANLRAPATAKSQLHGNTRVDWTPVFARGKVAIYVVDSGEAVGDDTLPQKLTDSRNLTKFVTNVLPRLLNDMKANHGWSDVPRTVVHDKASYFVSNAHDRLSVGFADALQKGGFRSWVGDGTASTSWLVKKWGDVYLHETLISHIRRLLDSDFASNKVYETPAQFMQRMRKVEGHLNSDVFAAPDGGGLGTLAKELFARCQKVIDLEGERIPR